MWKFVGLLTALAVVNACNAEADSGDPSPEREACVTMCALVACLGDVTSEQVSTCADRCMDKRDEARQRGAMCDTGYSRTVDCFAELTCDEYLAWEDGDTTVCETSMDTFNQSCGDLTFEFGP